VKNWKVIAAVVIGAAVFGGGVGRIAGTSDKALTKAEQAKQISEAVHRSQIAACQISLSPGGFRAQSAGDYRAEIKTHKGNIRRTRRTNFAKYSIVVSKKNRRNAIERDQRAIAHLRDKIQNVLGIDCKQLYKT
jgi:hypothetical protein